MTLKRYKLGELCDVKRGMSLSGEYYATEGELIRLTLGNFDYQNNSFKLNTSKDNLFFTGDVPEQFVMKKDDIITPLTEQTPGLLGSTAKIPEDDLYIQSQDVAKVICNEKLNPDFAFYLISSSIVKNQLGAGAQQTKIRHTSPDKIKDCSVFLPESLEEQKRIAQVLTDIDTKIALNKKINKELETMAKELYDYWFLQFDFPNAEGKPYKTSGGKMVYNEVLKREIPEGWEVKTLLDIANFTNGLACQKFRPTDETKKLPVIKIREMHDGITSDTEWVKSDIPDSVKVYNGDVLFSWSATLEVMLWCYGNGGLNQHIFKVTSNNGYPKSFYFYQLQDYVNVFKRMAEARKTTMGHITQDHLQQSQIVVPKDMKIPNDFEKLINPIFKKIILCNEEISNAKKLRDEILPLLMNGQVTVSN
ncbi:restriction endonuclease subunit S [Treponema sp.]|uniref:restriction endonuclease subunit S n=1 Tax=Treponema sp. TaxID=166 RepID=UPI00298E8AB4|nr:restriction endonuclease subunit S [Treponema sp.]MCQ2240433.1 restriction endonuclease subunit S [Treponema sp.]